MTKPWPLIMLLSILVLGCKKKSGDIPWSELPFEERIAGAWNLSAVSYDTEFPNPQNPLQMIEVTGDGEQVDGVFNLKYSPNRLDYNYSFIANVQVVDSIPAIPLPIERSGMGDWTATSDESRIFVTEDDGSSYTFEVVVNKENRQVYRSTFQENVLGFITIDVDVELTFTR